jgi:hypothetical protein
VILVIFWVAGKKKYGFCGLGVGWGKVSLVLMAIVTFLLEGVLYKK